VDSSRDVKVILYHRDFTAKDACECHLPKQS